MVIKSFLLTAFAVGVATLMTWAISLENMPDWYYAILFASIPFTAVWVIIYVFLRDRNEKRNSSDKERL